MIKEITKYFILFLAVAAFSCTNSAGDKEKLSFEVIREGSYSAITDKREVIIYNESEYQALMNDVYKNLDQKPNIPSVDFKKNSLVAVFIGSRTSGGFEVKIDNVTDGSDYLTVNVTETTPGKNCAVTDAITSPYVIVKIAKTEKKGQFKTKKIEKDCK